MGSGLDFLDYTPYTPIASSNPAIAALAGVPRPPVDTRMRGPAETLSATPTLSGPPMPAAGLAVGAANTAALVAGKAAGAGAAAGLLGSVAPVLAVAGIAMQMAGAYQQAKSQQSQLQMQALNLDMRSQVGILNAQAMERQSERGMESSRRQLGSLGLRRANERGKMVATAAARGGTMTGSVAEATASFDYGALLERYTINANAIAQREQVSLQGLQLRMQANMDELSAAGARATADAINPSIAAIAAGIGAAAQSIPTFMWSSRA